MYNYHLDRMIESLESDLNYMEGLGPECTELTNAINRLTESLMWMKRWDRRLRREEGEWDEDT